jgi:hypothetical protein
MHHERYNDELCRAFLETQSRAMVKRLQEGPDHCPK